MSMKNIEDGYFNYLADQIIDAIMEADGYNCKDFTALKLEMLVNLKRMLQSREKYEQSIEILRQDEERKKLGRKL